MRCDMCGKESNLFEAIVEGTRLNVCDSCVKFGKKIGIAKTKQEKEEEVKRIIEEKSETQVIEKINMVIPQASRLIKQKREQMNLTQEQLAKKMNIKMSVVQQAENSLISIPLARQFEKLMRIQLVKEYTESHKNIKIESKAPTIGNMIKFKVRKKR